MAITYLLIRYSGMSMDIHYKAGFRGPYILQNIGLPSLIGGLDELGVNDHDRE